MDDLKPEDDLKPDTSDRRPTRRRPASSTPKFAISRQHMMIGIGILVLLLLIIGIGSALKAPTQHETAQQNSNGAKEINLSGGETTAPATQNGVNSQAPVGQQPQDISVPPISDTPTQAPPLTPNPNQQRVELPGNMTDALSQQQGQVDSMSQGMSANQPTSTLPTAPATVAPTSKEATRAAQAKPAATTQGTKQHPVTATTKPTTAAKSTAKETVKSSTPATPAKPAATASSGGAINTAPANHFTLQLSSASRSDSLNAFARQQNLQHYLVYETSRDGKPWYVLVSGTYPTSADAKRAISSLPAEVQAKKPWVKPVRQVQQDLKK